MSPAKSEWRSVTTDITEVTQHVRLELSAE